MYGFRRRCVGYLPIPVVFPQIEDHIVYHLFGKGNIIGQLSSKTAKKCIMLLVKVFECLFIPLFQMLFNECFFHKYILWQTNVVKNIEKNKGHPKNIGYPSH